MRIGIGLGLGLLASVALAPVAVVDFTLGVMPSWLTFTATGNRMQWDSTGKLTYGPNNLLTYSSDWSNAAWSKINAGTGSAPTVTTGFTDPLGGTNANRIVFARGGGSTASDYSLIDRSLSFNSSNYIQSVWLKSNTGSTQNVVFYNSGASAGQVFSVTTSWQRFNLAVTSGTGSSFSFGTRGGSAYYTGGDASIDILVAFGVSSLVTYETTPRSQDQIQTTSSAYYGPRFDYDPSTLLPRGLLIEESRTNSALNSSTPSSWLTANVSYSAGGLSPDGASTYGLFTGTAGAAAHQVYSALSSVSNGVTYTASAFVKAGTANAAFIAVKLDATGNGMSAVVALDGTSDVSAIVTGAGTNVTIASSGGNYLGGGVYRIWVTGSISTGAGSPYIIVGQAQKTGNTLNPNSGEVTNSPGSLTMSAWGWQFETGSFATSYIPTTSTSVTRAADVVTIGGAALTALKGAAGSLVAEVQSISAGGSASNRIIGFDTVSQTPLFMFDNNTVGTYNGSIGVTAVLGSSGAWSSKARGAVAWSASGRSVVANGGTLQTDGNLMSGSAWTVGYIGSNVATNSFLNGWISKIAFYNQRLPNATLQAKSVVGASFYG